MAYTRRNWKETTAITAEELNRMEEGIDNITSGTWKPSVKWGVDGGTGDEGGSWGSQDNVGTWYRIGDLVFVYAYIYASTKKSTGDLIIRNLPFAPANAYTPLTIGHFFGLEVGDGYMITARAMTDKRIEFVRQAITANASKDDTAVLKVSDAKLLEDKSRHVNISLSAVYKIA